MGSTRLSARQSESKAAAFARFAPDVDRAAVRFDDAARDRQSQSGAAAVARARFFAAKERLEDVRQVLGRDAIAGIDDLDLDLLSARARLRGDRDLFARRRVANRVLHEIG